MEPDADVLHAILSEINKQHSIKLEYIPSQHDIPPKSIVSDPAAAWHHAADKLATAAHSLPKTQFTPLLYTTHLNWNGITHTGHEKTIVRQAAHKLQLIQHINQITPLQYTPDWTTMKKPATTALTCTNSQQNSFQNGYPPMDSRPQRSLPLLPAN